MRNLIITISILIFSQGILLSNESADGKYISVEIEKGESIYALLKKYDLANIQCNVAAFYDINKITKDDILYYGKYYKLPILNYKYNGSSIRSTIGIDDYNKALRIQKYNEALEANGIKSKSLYKNNVLWVPFHELNCEITDNNISTSKSEDSIAGQLGGENKENYVFDKLYGKKYSSVKIEDRSLAGKVYYIVSGHGGPDPGAVCSSVHETMCEDEYAYDVSLRLARNLTQHGATVHMIVQDANDGIRDEEYLECDKDETCIGNKKIPLNQVKRLHQRASAINELYAQHSAKGITDQRAIIIHVDSRGKNQKQDVFFYHLEGSKKGNAIAENLHSTFDQKYSKYQKNRGYQGYVKARGLYMLRNTTPPAVYVELANIRNKYDHKRLIYAYNRQALANWLFEGLIK
jgi:N-acetylmuramoyl-L-alanine amidase